MSTKNNKIVHEIAQISARIEEIRQRSSLSAVKFAEKAGLNAGAYHSTIRRKGSFKAQDIAAIARAYGTSADWILGLGHEPSPSTGSELTPIEAQGMGFFLIPLYAARAGAGDEKIALSAEPVNLLAFREEWIRSELRRHPRDLFLLTVEGDSMYPTLVPGEVVLVDKTVARVSADAIYLLRVFGGIMVKRAQLHADGLHLLSDNPAYERRIIRHDELENGVEILGRVIWGGRRY